MPSTAIFLRGTVIDCSDKTSGKCTLCMTGEEIQRVVKKTGKFSRTSDDLAKIDMLISDCMARQQSGMNTNLKEVFDEYQRQCRKGVF